MFNKHYKQDSRLNTTTNKNGLIFPEHSSTPMSRIH